jgi:hypothetical protein
MNRPDLEKRADRYELAQLLYDTCDHEHGWHFAGQDERDRFLDLADVAIGWAGERHYGPYPPLHLVPDGA